MQPSLYVGTFTASFSGDAGRQIARATADFCLNSRFFFLFSDIRVQLNDQLKSLDNRLEIQQAIVNEFQDIFRRKAEIELNYSKELDKLAKTINNRNKEHKQK